MKWPFKRREERTAGYTSLIVAGLEATAAADAGNVLRTGALEIAAGLWGRTLAAANIEGAPEVLTARVRHTIGRDLIRHGESVHLIAVEPRLHLEPVAAFDVRKGWRYELHLPEPEGVIVRRNVSRHEVLHLRWSVDPLQPWLGVSPLGVASLLGKLSVGAEGKITEDLATPTAALVPIPTDGAGLEALRTDIGEAKGKAVLLESTSAGWGEGTQSGTRNDWKAERLGPTIPEGLRSLYSDVSGAVFAACGIPASLAGADADGTQLREDYRRWIMATVQPVADMIAEDASMALDTEVSFNFGALWAHDIVGRSSAAAKLVTAGMSAADAARLTGLDSLAAQSGT